VDAALAAGAEKARVIARETMGQVREAMGLGATPPEKPAATT
jgi:hypothetical protein